MKTKKQPIIFADGPQDKFVEGEQVMDVLIHYAQSGIHEAERVMRDEPDFFSQEEVMDLVASKTVLGKAPDIIEEYKRKFREFAKLHDKVQSVVRKCELIVHEYEGRRQSVESQKQSGNNSEPPRLDSNMIRYTADGEITVKKAKKVNIELPKHDEH